MLYSFEDCTLDTRRHELCRAGLLIALDRQVFEVLVYLLVHADHVVTRQEFFEHLWPQRCVSDAALERCITVARRALGDNGRAQRCIKTVHGLGYRFVAAVAAHPDAELRPLALPRSSSLQHIPSATLPSSPVRAREGAWEQKPVAVLAIELTWPDSAAFETRGDAPWRVTAAWQQTLVKHVQELGGVILQRSPALLLVAFGIPQTLEQLPQRAVQAALVLRQLVVEASNGGSGPEVRLVGHWGALLVDVQSADPTALLQACGETLAWPVRLLGQTAPGEILVSPGLGDLVAGWYELAGHEAPLAGRPPQQASVYTVVGPKPQGARRALYRQRPLSPFVGRDRELATLQALMALAVEGRGQVVGLMGEPGMGKSRLCYEYMTRHVMPPWACLETHAVAYGQTIPYLPMTELLKAYFRLDSHASMPMVRDQVSATLLALDAALKPTLPALLTLLDVPVEEPHWQTLEPPQRRQRLLDAIKRLLLQASLAQPLLIIVENLHWIDTETQACLDSLVECLPTARLLLLVTYRPEYQHNWGHKTYYTQMRLDPLSHEHAQALLDTFLGHESDLAALKQRVLARTQGNPFFVEESVQTLIEMGGVVGEPGAYRLGSLRQTLQVPATVQAVLAARIDRLPQETKSLLQTAAVIGTEVPVPLLRAIAELDEEGLHRGLAQLQAAEFLYETWRLSDPAYTFKHALTQEVTYGSLLQERRRVLHARIVEAFEALAADRVAEGASGAQGLPAERQTLDQVELLAYHALRGEVWDKAVTCCQQAGARAYDHAAFREAVASFEQGIQALAHLPESGDTRILALDLRLALGSALAVLGEYRRDLALMGETETLARALDDRARLGRVLAQMTNALRNTGDHDGAVTAGRQALALAAELSDSALQVRASMYLGQTYWVIGNFGQAAELLRWVVEVTDQESGVSSTDVRIRSRAWLAVILSALGAFAEGQQHGEEALRLATLAGQGVAPVTVHACLGPLYLAQGDLEYAIRVFDQGLALCRASGSRAFLPSLVAGLGYASALQGRLAEGRALLEEGIRESTNLVATQPPSWSVWLSEVCRLAGYGEEARQHAHQALVLARQQKERGNEALALHQMGVIHAHAAAPDIVGAEAYYCQALILADELGMRPLQAHCHRGLGMLYAATGQQEQARTALSTAIAMYKSMDMTFWLPRTETALAQVDA